MLEFFGVGEATGKEEECHFFIAKTLLFKKRADNVRDFVASEVEFSFNGCQSGRSALIADHVTDVGQSDQDAGAVVVAQASFDVKFSEKFCINLDTTFQVVRKFINQIVFFLSHV